MMPLSVAMAMSGLEADEFTDFKEIYNHGVALIDNKSKLLINNNDRRSSSSASNGSSTSTTTTAESGIDLNMCLMERPICINKNIAHRCPSFDVNMNEYKKYCDNNSSATNFNQIIIKESDSEDINDDLKIIYNNRNILDLAKNLRSSWKVNYAVLEGGVNCFFENRSQLSRLANLEPPLHKNYTCNKDDDCQFVIQHYF